MRESLDLLIIHAPKFSGYYKPYGEYMTVNLLPMGTLALADLAVQKGYGTKILHLGLQWIEKGDFSPLDYLDGKDVKVAAIPLHWHQQSYQVMEAAREIKEKRPDIYIVLGGNTASYFHKEIMASYPQIDAVVRGDGEAPLPALMAAVVEGKGKEKVQNLTWREGKEIRENALSYVWSGEDREDPSYANLELLEHSGAYIRFFGMPFVWAKGLSKEENRKHFHLGLTLFPLNIGRGCTGNCTWCGGGSRAQYEVNGRKGVVFRAPEKVADTVAEATAKGYEMIHVAFDPGREGDRYYQDLFSLLKERDLRTRCYFESFSLPTESFLHYFADTFLLKGSVLALSPESGDERVRARNKSFSFSDEALMKAVSLAEGLGIKVDIFFAMGIPGEKYSDLQKTSSLCQEIKRRFRNIGRTWTSPITLEPGAPWYEDPESFGIVSTRKSFYDFYRASSPDGGGLGYYIPDYVEGSGDLDEKAFEALLKDTKCRNHCSFHSDPSKANSPFRGRLYCRYRSWRMGGFHG